MENYQSNSHKTKEQEQLPEKKVEKVITGTAKARKKSELRKFTDVFVQEDMQSIKSYILVDVLVPAVKKAISDIVTNGIDMLLYGESGRTRETKKTNVSKVSYRSYYDSPAERPGAHKINDRMGYNHDDIFLENRGEAEDVLSCMEDIIERYGMASVQDLYDLVGMTGKYTDNKYGWTNVRNATVVRVKDGYLIKMPKALPLD